MLCIIQASTLQFFEIASYLWSFTISLSLFEVSCLTHWVPNTYISCPNTHTNLSTRIRTSICAPAPTSTLTLTLATQMYVHIRNSNSKALTLQTALPHTHHIQSLTFDQVFFLEREDEPKKWFLLHHIINWGFPLGMCVSEIVVQ